MLGWIFIVNSLKQQIRCR